MIILVVGAYLRLYQIGVAPPGLYRDEGFYGLDALNVLRGSLSVYFPANNGREGLFVYVLAASISVFGRTVLALRVTSALVGIATLFAIYAAARNLFSHRVGVLSAGILAVTFWHVALSRVAYRAITLPLLLCVFVACAVAAARSAKPAAWSVATGVLLGLVFYTYTSGQFVLLLLAAFALWNMRALRPAQYARPAIVALLTVAPLLIYIAQHPDTYFARAGQVSIFSSAINKGDWVGMLLNNVLKAAGMFMFAGDRIWRHNLSLKPVFDLWLGVAFVVGVCVLLWKAFGMRTDAEQATGSIGSTQANPLAPRFLLLWLVVFLLPTIFAEDTPHFLRGIGALPAACMVCAYGLEQALGFASRRGYFLVFGRLARLVSPPAAVAALLLGMAGWRTYTDYFTVYVNTPLTGYWLEAQNVELARQINLFSGAPQQIWLDETLAQDNASLKFLAPAVENNQVTLVRANQQKNQTPAHDILLLVDPNRDYTPLRNSLPLGSEWVVGEGPLAQGDLDAQPRRAFISLLALQPRMATPVLKTAQFQQGIALSVTSVLQPNASQPALTQVTLRWRTAQTISQDYAVFVHWFRNGQLLAQHDGTPADGYLPMPVWRVGDVIVDKHTLAIAGGVQAGDELRVGIYNRTTQQRLGVLNASGNIVGDAVVIGQ